MTIIGYARVSTADQDLSTQLAALKKAGASAVYREKISGVRADRPQLKKLMTSLQKGDVVLVTKLDRLGRSTRELLQLIHDIDNAGAAFRSLGDPLFDTSTSQGRLPVTMLAAIAEFGAMANGVKFGRPRALDSYQRKEAVAACGPRQCARG